MKASLISIGDELLIGQVVNTNAAKIGEMLNLAGVKVVYTSVVQDERQSIIEALEEAGKKANLVIITGGLGPTKDDITKKVLCEFFNDTLIINQNVLDEITTYFKKKGKEITELNKKQAEVPTQCEVIKNPNGTAPGMWFNFKGITYVSIPGVPYEALAMMENYILPRIKKENELPVIFHYTIHTQGIGESYLANLIEDWEDSLGKENIKLAYLPSPGVVRLRLSGFGHELNMVKSNVLRKKEELLPLIKEYVYGYEEFGSKPPMIHQLLGEELLRKNRKIALAESCTGGYVSHLLTSIPGASAYFNGCIVPYQNEFKRNLLGVDEKIFNDHGAVSEECVKSMAKGILNQYKSDYAIAISGIAGPTGGTSEKPVGTVWIAWANKEDIITEKFVFTNDRNRNIQLSAINAMGKMRKLITNGF